MTKMLCQRLFVGVGFVMFTVGFIVRLIYGLKSMV